MSATLSALAGSVQHLRDIAEPLESAQLRSRGYPSEWTIADVLSHVGSGAVIMRRRLDDSLAGIPRDTLFVCHSGAQGVLAEAGKAESSCNAVFAKLGQIPRRNKDLVLTHADAHGTPALSSAHGVCATGGAPDVTVDAYDWNFCWKVWDAMRSCAYDGTDCRYALGDTRQHRSNGRWSDGLAIAPLKIQDAAPIRP